MSDSSQIMIPDYFNVPKWSKEHLVDALMSLKYYWLNCFPCYFGKDVTKEEVSNAILSVEYVRVESAGRKHRGGFAFRIIVDHDKLSNQFKSVLEHLVIITPEAEEDGVVLYANIFDGRTLAYNNP